MIVLESGSMVSMVSVVGMVTFGVVDSGAWISGFTPIHSCHANLGLPISSSAPNLISSK